MVNHSLGSKSLKKNWDPNPTQPQDKISRGCPLAVRYVQIGLTPKGDVINFTFDCPGVVDQQHGFDVYHLYFDTATFDEIERDAKNSFEDQLGVVGGTMGLFTGFSILSGIEILFYLGKGFLRQINKRL